MKIMKNNNGRAVAIKLDREDTLEEMSAMAAMSMETLAEIIEGIIAESRKTEEGTK